VGRVVRRLVVVRLSDLAGFAPAWWLLMRWVLLGVVAVWPLSIVGLVWVLWDAKRHPPTPHARYIEALVNDRLEELRIR
jgi:hypothetical protein